MDTQDILKICSQADMVHQVGKEDREYLGIPEDMEIPDNILGKVLEDIQQGSSFLGSMEDTDRRDISGDTGLLGNKEGMVFEGRKEDMALPDNIQGKVYGDILEDIYNLDNNLDMVEGGIQLDS